MNYRKESSGFASICRRFLFVALMAVVSLSAAAQGKSVHGTVVDVNGDPLIGVTVIVKGTTNGTSTDFDGAYTLKNVADNATRLQLCRLPDAGCKSCRKIRNQCYSSR